MSTPVVEEEARVAPIREIISIILLLLGTILVSVGSFLLWNLAGGLFVVGVLFIILAVVIGYRK